MIPVEFPTCKRVWIKFKTSDVAWLTIKQLTQTWVTRLLFCETNSCLQGWWDLIGSVTVNPGVETARPRLRMTKKYSPGVNLNPFIDPCAHPQLQANHSNIQNNFMIGFVCVSGSKQVQYRISSSCFWGFDAEGAERRTGWCFLLSYSILN